jgi:hypothetical protein
MKHLLFSLLMLACLTGRAQQDIVPVTAKKGTFTLVYTTTATELIGLDTEFLLFVESNRLTNNRKIVQLNPYVYLIIASKNEVNSPLFVPLSDYTLNPLYPSTGQTEK